MTLASKDLRWGIVALAALIVACGEEQEGSTADNSPPAISGTPGTAIAVNSSYMFAPSAIDADGDPLAFGINGKPPWAFLNTSNGQLSGMPTSGDVGTYRGIVIWVSDGEKQTLLPAFDLTVVGGTTGANSAPTVSGTPLASVVAGAPYTFTPIANDSNRDPLSFTIRNRPSWATFSAANGRLQGTPQAANVGMYRDIVISVSDGQSTIAMPPFSIAVALPTGNSAPSILGAPMSSVEAGSLYAFVPTATDDDGDSLTFAIAGRPAWATFNGQTGALRGTPPANTTGTFGNISIQVSDGVASATLPAFSITVTAPTANTAPMITGLPLTSATAGLTYSFQPNASDANGDPLTFTIANRPTWAAFDAATGRLQGTPGANHVRTYGNIVIGVTDGKTLAQLSPFSIAVAAANNAPTISGTPAGSVLQGTSYLFQPTANDADGDVLTFTILNKPAWATFSVATGRLQGTPGPADLGTTSGIVIRATDGEADAVLTTFSITVQAAATGSATLSWVPPTQNSDGSPLTNLAGYKVYWGASAGDYPNSVTLNNPGLSAYMVENLVPGTYFFATTAFNTAGTESVFSNAASKIIQ